MAGNFFKTVRDGYAEVRRQTPLYAIQDSTLVAWLFSARISPVFTAIFVKRGVRPNSITVLMILSGLLGAALFAVDNVFVKVAGYVFIQLWFVMDCCDGEVARMTKDFSKYGTEMDYLAHILTHPAFQTAFLVSAIQLYTERGADLIPLIVIFAAIAVVELMIRAMLGLQLICKFKDAADSPTAPAPVPSMARRIRGLLLSAIYVYPNVALFFPLVYFADLIFGTKLGYWYAIVILAVSLPMMAKLAFQVVTKLGTYPVPRGAG